MLSSYLIGLTLGALASGAAAQESSAAELSASSTSEGITGRPSPTRTSSASDGPPTHTVYVGRVSDDTTVSFDQNNLTDITGRPLTSLTPKRSWRILATS